MIYFVQTADNQYIKVGKADDVRKRLAGLQTSAPQQLKLLGAMAGGHEQERAIHQRFFYLRARGEWFRAGPDLVSFAVKSSALAHADMSNGRMRAFFDLAVLEPKLLDLYGEAAATHDDGEAQAFCANEVFFGYWDYQGRGIKRRLLKLVGWHVEFGTHPRLTTEEAYDIAYETIYEALPDCRGCACAPIALLING